MLIIGVLCVSIFYLFFSKKYKWLYIFYKTAGRDIKAIIGFIFLNYHVWKFEKYTKTVAKQFLKNVKRHPQKVAIIHDDKKWTFREMEDFSNRVAHYFKNAGFKRADTVSLLMENSPEFVCIWLGLSKIGVITALINTNLVSDPLLHCIKVSNSKGLIYGSQFYKAVDNIRSEISDIKLYPYDSYENAPEDAKYLKNEFLNEPIIPLTEEIDKATVRDKLLLIYTSGTTGLPKAAFISHQRYNYMAGGLHFLINFRSNDIIYVPLPLYHSGGGIGGIGQCILFGLTVVIRKKFSASNFWNDCIKNKCTVAQYIGELCRYLLASYPNDKSPPLHCIRVMFGNGLKPQIWERFVKKFNIKRICEFYGSTEGNSNVLNVNGHIGAVGFVPRYGKKFLPVGLIKFDENSGEPIRNSQGLCIECEPNEEGIFIGKINTKRAINNFEGYADKKATNKKIIRDVFVKGDAYFNSGDVLIQDEFGYFYFKDRTGDTFRWKGENVSTSEVEAIISNIIGLNDAVVYGVEIPHTEGKVGMVAIMDVNDTLDLDQLYKGCKVKLPAYSIPYFVRVVKSLPMTGTYKLKKNKLQKEGFDIDKCKESKDHHLYFLDVKNGGYVELTREIFDQINNGKIKL